LPAAFLVPGVFARLATAAALAPALILLWRLRDADPGEERFGFALAVALAATLLFVPTWPGLHYNHLLLIPAALVIVGRWANELSGRQRIMSVIALATLGFSSAGALLVSLAVLVFRVPAEQLGRYVKLPLFNFAIVPFVVSTVLIGLLWKPIPRRKLYQVAGSQG
jgi:hypothetical protein